MPINYAAINFLCLQRFLYLVKIWLPSGRLDGQEWVALNPTRHDNRVGSFKVNTATGKWADFATNDRGGDPISLYAYLNNLSQKNAALELQRKLEGTHG